MQVLHPLSNYRRCSFADIHEHFELITKAIDQDAEEVVGVKCRFCDTIILDEMTARQLLLHGARAGKDPLIGALTLLSFPLLLWGGLHMLTCTRKKVN